MYGIGGSLPGVSAILCKMADVPLVLSHPLCFLVNKLGKSTLKVLKSALTDFYDVEALATAKFRLLEDINDLHSSVNFPHVPRRRDGDNRLVREADDLLTLLTVLDENKLIDQLPKYVSDSPDNMPAVRLYEGDFNVFIVLLERMNNKLSEFGSALGAITSEVNSLHQVSRELSHLKSVVAHAAWPRSTAATAGDVNTTNVKSVFVDGDFPSLGHATETDSETTRISAVPDWAAAVSTPRPSGSRFAVLSTDDDDHNDDNEPQFVTVGRRGNKRPRQHSSPQQPQRHQPQQQQLQQPAQIRQRQQAATGQQKSRLVGKAAAISNISIKAAKKIRKKAVFCIDNVDTSCTVEHMRSFVGSLSIEVITCFEVKPRQRRNETAESVRYVRKAFRLCIHDDERDRLLSAVSWPDSITVSEWYFKPQSSGDDQRQVANDVTSRDTTKHASSSHQSYNHSRPNAVAATAVAAPTDDAVLDRDRDTSVTAMLGDDDTILQVNEHSNNGDENK